MKKGVVVFQSEVLEMDKIVFQDPSGSVTAPSNDALVVNKNDHSSSDNMRLDHISQLLFSSSNLTVDQLDGSSSVFPLNDIAKLTFTMLPTSGIRDVQAQSPEVIAYINSDGAIEVECAAEIQSLRLFTIEGKTVATVVETLHATSLQCPAAGIYLLSVETAQGTVVKKIIKY